MDRQLYGINTLQGREKYGLGSSLKKFVRNIIPNELAEIAVKAAPFVAPFNPLLAGYMSAIGSFDQTGRIGSSIKSGLINYGLGQVASGIGGAGFQGGIDPFAKANFSGGFTSGIQSLFTNPIGNQPFGTFQSTTPTTPIQTSLGYTGGADALTYDPTTGQQLGRTIPELQSSMVSGGGLGPNETGRSASELIKTYGTPPGTQPGYVDLIKQAGSLDPNVSITQRFDAVKDLGQKALQDIYTKPIRNAAGEIVDRELDKSALISTAVTASTYADALGLLSKAGDPDPGKTLSEADYQRLNIDPEKAKLTSLRPEAFGIRNLSADGGMMNDMQSGVLSITLTPADRKKFQLGSKGRSTSNNRVSQIIQLIRDAESIGDMEKAEELRLDLFRETKKANGGRVRYQQGGLGSMDPMLALQRSPIDQYGYSDPVISALTGNIFTSGQRFKDVFSPQAGLMMQQAQAAGYSEPEMEELRLQHDFFPSFQRGLNEAYFGPTFQADPQKSTIDLATSIYNQRFQAPPSVQQQQQRPQTQYQYSSRGTPIEQYGYTGTPSPELQAQIDMQKRALDRVESIYNKPMTNIRGDEKAHAFGGTGGMKYNQNELLQSILRSEQEASARVTPKKANGGRINYFMGSEIPVRQNQGGITELDLRAKGGYIPVGIKEKADDVPAMLSKNEFVFTADAVRGAGKGNINKGAQKMYKLMKSLEKKIKKQKGN